MMVKRTFQLIMAAGALVFLFAACGPQPPLPAEGDGASGSGQAYDSAVQIEYITVRRRNMEMAGQYTGEMRPIKESQVLPQIDAVVETVAVSLGDSVSEGDILFTLNDNELRKAVNEQETNLQVAELNQSQADLSFKAFQLRDTTEQLEDETLLQGEINDINLRTAEIKYNSAAQSLQAAREKLKLANHTAPFPGTVVMMDVEKGMSAKELSLYIADLSSGTVTIYVDDTMLACILEGDEVDVVFTSGSWDSIKGKISVVNPYYYVSGKGYPVEVEAPMVSGQKPYGFVQVTVQGIASDAFAVPAWSLMEDEAGAYVYVVNGDDTVTRRNITLGAEYSSGGNEWTAVVSGLMEGDKVASSGLRLLKDGTRVVAVEKTE